MTTLNWRNLDDLTRDTMKLAPKLRDVDAIIGVPRSGMLPATILACALHKPVGMLGWDGMVAIGSGYRLERKTEDATVALVDDSVLTGSAMREAQDHPEVWDHDSVVRACVYLQPGAEEHVDVFAVELPAPRVFEWNLFGSEMVKHSMLDIDGVLCPDPPYPESDEARYAAYIADAPLLHRPLFPVAALATNRIERYREVTEAWLARHGIEYGTLLMAPFPTPEARRRMSSPITLKSAWYSLHNHPGILIESHDWIAEQVARNVGRPVVSLESRRCFQ